jgi:hypothetical protein
VTTGQIGDALSILPWLLVDVLLAACAAAALVKARWLAATLVARGADSTSLAFAHS